MRDTGSFDELYRATAPRLMRYAYGLTGDLGEAQDLVQEAYVRAWQRWRRLGEYEHIEAWLRLVVNRLATDRWRRLRSRRATMARTGPQQAVLAPGEDTVVLVGALRRLPAAQRRAVVLHHLCDLSVAEIATEAGVAVGTVKSWLARGRAALAVVLGELKPEVSREHDRREVSREHEERAERAPQLRTKGASGVA